MSNKDHCRCLVGSYDVCDIMGYVILFLFLNCYIARASSRFTCTVHKTEQHRSVDQRNYHL
jgi:hypothetical protein